MVASWEKEDNKIRRDINIISKKYTLKQYRKLSPEFKHRVANSYGEMFERILTTKYCIECYAVNKFCVAIYSLGTGNPRLKDLKRIMTYLPEEFVDKHYGKLDAAKLIYLSLEQPHLK